MLKEGVKMGIRKIAVISDVHGNILALDAVLRDIEKRGINEIINLGDCITGPLEPAKTADRLIKENIICLRGNNERALITYKEESQKSATFKYVENMLTDEIIDWIRRMPKELVYDSEIYACHGTPESDKIYLLEHLGQNKVSIKKEEQIRTIIASVAQPVILCGHSHLPGTVHLTDGRLIVNPGSVGLTAYSDDMPVYHEMISGSPHAKYAIITKEDSVWKAEKVSVAYDWESAAHKARENGREDWAEWLLTGKV